MLFNSISPNNVPWIQPLADIVHSKYLFTYLLNV